MASSSKMIVLTSSDKERFEVEESVLSESSTIKNMIEDVKCADVIPLPNVTSNVLAKVIEFCTHHHTDSAFGTHFAKVNHDIMFELILAANYLHINSLLDLTIQYVADVIKGKSMEEVRTSFNIRNDFTPEEEEEVRKENAWAFRDANGRN